MTHELEGRIPPKRETFGHLEKTRGRASRKRGIAEAQGWNDLKVEEVKFPGGVVRFKLTGVPVFRRLYEMGGYKPGPVNQPRVVNPKRRKGQDYRYGGG